MEGAAVAVEELEALMLRYQAGDEEAFAMLYARLAGAIRGYLRHLTPPGSDVDDLTQGTFLQLHRARRSYLPGAPVRPWLFAIARHVGWMARRTSARRGRHEQPSPEELPEIPTLARAAGALDRIALERALRELPESVREALWLHHVEGFSFREIGAVQGTSEGAAKVRAHRALTQLRTLLTREVTS